MARQRGVLENDFYDDDDDGMGDDGRVPAPQNGGEGGGEEQGVPDRSIKEVRRREIIAWCNTNLLLHEGRVPRVAHKVIWLKAARKQRRGGTWTVQTQYKSVRTGYTTEFQGHLFMEKIGELGRSVAAPPNPRENGPRKERHL